MIRFRNAGIQDAPLYFDWANDKTVRDNSYNRNSISYAEHVDWFTKKLNSPDCFFYLFLNENEEPVGQVRIDKTTDEIIIGISIDENFRGKDLGATMLRQACEDYLTGFPFAVITAYIKETNIASVKTFLKAGFTEERKIMIGEDSSYCLKKTKDERH